MSKKQNNYFRLISASSHSMTEREKDDYYATEPKATKLLLEQESFNNILEPCCGEGHISKELLKQGLQVNSSDLIDRGFGEVIDFFNIKSWDGDIVTNPPYKYAKEFIEHSLDIIQEGAKVAMFLKVTFLESQKRKELFIKNPPKILYVSSSRLRTAKNGEFEKYGSSAVAYGWFIWEKGFKGNTIIKWIN